MTSRCTNPRKGATSTGKSVIVDGRKRLIYKGPKGGKFYISNGCKQYLSGKKTSGRKSSGKKAVKRSSGRKSSGKKAVQRRKGTTFCGNKIDPKRRRRWVVNPTSLRVVKADGEIGCGVDGPFMTKINATKKADAMRLGRKKISPRRNSRGGVKIISTTNLSPSKTQTKSRSRSPPRKSRSPRGEIILADRAPKRIFKFGIQVERNDRTMKELLEEFAGSDVINAYVEILDFFFDDGSEIIISLYDKQTRKNIWLYNKRDVQKFLGLVLQGDDEMYYLNALYIPFSEGFSVFQKATPNTIVGFNQTFVFEEMN